jgi:hypothetical protein
LFAEWIIPLRIISAKHFFKDIVGRWKGEETFIKWGFYIDTPHIFAKIRKQLRLLVFPGVTPFPTGLY